MNYDEYFQFVSDKKTQINYMHQVIKKGIEGENHTKVQYEVLLRGYIVLIYSFWEGAYKSLPSYFFEKLKEIKVESLPYRLKDKIIKQKINNKKAEEMKSHRWLEVLNRDVNLLKNTACGNHSTMIEFFKNNSNNPKTSDLIDLLVLYHFTVPIEEDLRKEIDFIIQSRNDIAHSGMVVRDYHLKIFEEFNMNLVESEEIQRNEAVNKLQRILNNIFVLYKDIADKFQEKYSEDV